MYAARLRFSDGYVSSFEVADGQTVLEAAMSVDAPLRFDCASGSCGACIAQVTGGETLFDTGGPSPICAAEAAAGLRPTCQTRLASDAQFDLPYPLLPAPSQPSRHTTEVTAVERIADTVFRLSLVRPEGFAFQSGQYVRLRPPGCRSARAYSISSAPADASQLEFMIRIVPDGMVSGWLTGSAAAGDRVTLQGPLGAFALDRAAARHVFVVGGTGLAPAMSMLRDLKPKEGEALVCFGANTGVDIFHLDELWAFAAEGRHQVRFAVGAGDPPPRCVTGTAVSLLTAADVVAGSTYYLCGPPGMVAAARSLLSAQGVPAQAIRSERYLPSA